MTLEDAIHDAETAFNSIFATHPDIETDLANAATASVAGLKDVATTVAAQVAPSEADVLDAIIGRTQSALDAEIAAVQAKYAPQIAALQTAKGSTQ